MITGLVIPSDPNKPVVEMPFEDLPDYQAAVGGYIEGVYVHRIRQTFFVNEEGKVRRLPLNWRATCHWWLHEPTARQVDFLVGDVALVGAGRQQGSTTDLPEGWTTMLSKEGSYALEYQFGANAASESEQSSASRWQRMHPEFASYFVAARQGLEVLDRSPNIQDVRVVAA